MPDTLEVLLDKMRLIEKEMNAALQRKAIDFEGLPAVLSGRQRRMEGMDGSV